MKRLIIFLFLFGSFLMTGKAQIEGYTIIESNTGIEDIHDDSQLNLKAIELQTLVNTTGPQGFEVLGCDFFPVLAYVHPTEGFANLFDKAVSSLKLTKQSFLMITKEHQTDSRLFYRTYIKFPDLPPFDQLGAFEEQVINSLVEEAVKNEAAANGNSTSASAKAEIAGINKLIELFTQVINGTLDLGSNVMAAAGFEAVPVKETGYFDRTGGSSISLPDGNNIIHDFAGLKVGSSPSPAAFYRSMVSIDPTQFTLQSMHNMTQAVVLTDAQNTSGELANAKEEFEGTDKKLAVWMHFNPIDSEGKIDTVYIKFDDNITIGEAEAIVDELFVSKMAEWMPEITFSTGGGVALKDKVEEVRRVMNCSEFSFKYGKDCLIGGGTVTSFGGGIGAGLLDGLLGTIETVYEGGKSIGDVLSGIWDWGVNYTKELYEHGVNNGSLTSVFEKIVGDGANAIEEAAETIVELYKAAKALTANFGEIVDGLVEGVIAWLKELAGGTVNAGYDVGVLAFDLIVSAFTGGTYGGSSFLTKILGWVKDLETGAKGVFDKMIAKVKNTAAGSGAYAKKFFRCKVLGKGCFIAGTPVLISGHSIKKTGQTLALATTLPFATSIENVTIDDYVRSFKHDEGYYTTASNEVDMGTEIWADWQDYDYIDITPTTWKIGTFVITEEDGSLIEIEANRPKEWFKNKGVEKGGDEVEFYMPEFGIFGSAVLQGFRETNTNTTRLDKTSSGVVDRPVITTFKRVVDEIVDYKFSNGQSISCTPDHLFFSVDQQNYISIGELQIGEKILTSADREVRFIGGKLRDKGEPVYNFEVWREHNYFVGGHDEWLLAHNACWNTIDEVKAMSKADRDAFLDDIWEKGIEWTPANQSSVFGRGSFMESLLRDTKYKNKKATGKNRNGGSDANHIGNDQYPTIDFVDGDNVISVKTTKKTNPYAWVASGQEGNKYIEKNIERLLEGIRDGEIGSQVSGIKKADLDVFIKDFDPEFPKVEWEKAVNKHIDKLPASLKAHRNKLSVNVSRINDAANQ